MVGARNWRLLKIAITLAAVVIGIYVIVAWRNESQIQTDRLAAARQEYQELRKNFNKLTDELKS